MAKVFDGQCVAGSSEVAGDWARKTQIAVEARPLREVENCAFDQLDGDQACAGQQRAPGAARMEASVHHEVSTRIGSGARTGPNKAIGMRIPILHLGQRRRSLPVSAR